MPSLHLNLHLFGPGTLKQDGATLRLHSAKTFALLVYLVLEPGKQHSRERLASMLWGEQPEGAARQSLRQALYSLRRVGQHALRDCFSGEGDLLSFDPGQDIQSDVLSFTDCVRSMDVSRWEEAAKLYHAPLLDGRDLAQGDVFEQWLARNRERFHALALQNLDRLVIDRMSHADWEGALRHAERLRDLDPSSEAVARHLFRILAARNAPQLIEAEWTRLCNELAREFGVRPSRETEELYRALTEARGSATGLANTAARHERSSLALPPAPRGAALDPEPLIRAAHAAQRLQSFSQALDLYERALTLLDRQMPSASSRVCDLLLYKAAVLERMGRRVEQLACIERLLQLAQGLSDESLIASALLRKAGACAYLGELGLALKSAGQALQIHRELKDLPGQAEALRELGFVHWQASDYQSALLRSREALELHRHLGDIAGEASALHNLAEIYRQLGSPRQSLEWYEQALKLHWAAGSHEGEILTLFGMAAALEQLGDVDAARKKYEQALALSETHGERTMQSRALHALAMQQAAQLNPDSALTLIRRAIEVDRSIGYAHGLGHDLVDLAHMHVARGERMDARAVLLEAQVWFGFTEDLQALALTQVWIDDLDAGRPPTQLQLASRPGVKSHLSFGEGKVYCAFESPLGALLRA